MKKTAIFDFNNRDIKDSTITMIPAKHELDLEPQELDLKKMSETEDLIVKDRFYFAQYFPIKENQLSENFLEIHVNSEKKRQLLRGLTKRHCELYGVVGRRAFHIFDKTHKTWICSSKALGYQLLSSTADKDADTDDERIQASSAIRLRLFRGAMSQALDQRSNNQ